MMCLQTMTSDTWSGITSSICSYTALSVTSHQNQNYVTAAIATSPRKALNCCC
uniref:Uncharacterized protein n=1 Tax=Arundo donax TaxID=35708 RepID=A0A0A8XSL3_ARUDO